MTTKCSGIGCPIRNCALRPKEHEIRTVGRYGHRNEKGLWVCLKYETAKAGNENEPEEKRE